MMVESLLMHFFLGSGEASWGSHHKKWPVGACAQRLALDRPDLTAEWDEWIVVDARIAAYIDASTLRRLDAARTPHADITAAIAASCLATPQCLI
jgi:hypothetical protein